MKKEETFQILEEYLKGIPVYNTHSHHPVSYTHLTLPTIA